MTLWRYVTAKLKDVHSAEDVVSEVMLSLARRIHRILSAGLYAYWNGMREVRIETVDTRTVRFVHDDLKVIVRAADASRLLDVCAVNRYCAAVLFVDGRFVDTLALSPTDVISKRRLAR